MTDQEILGAAMAYTDKHGGGGGGGTKNYNELSNKPQIGGVTLSGNKSASDLGLADNTTVQGILNGQSINNFGAVETALEGKQDALTAGDYIALDGNEISVNRELVPQNTTYVVTRKGEYSMNITKYIDGVQSSSTDYGYSQGTTHTIDDAFTLNDMYDSTQGYAWQFIWLKDSTTHSAGYEKICRAYSGDIDFTEVFIDEDLSGYKLVIKSEMDNALSGKADASDVKKEFGGTLDQWNALTTEEKKEYDTYDITDDYSDGNYIYLPTIYSEEEREVGVWKDGKPLYQRTVEFNFTSNTGDWTVFDDSVSYDKFIQAIATTKGVNIEDQITSYQNASASPRWCVRNDHKLYYYLDNAPRGGLVTLQYTKTTDTAGSGTWTPTGELAHHYSTDEQIIGTWIDGKTLYRKVIDLGALPNNTSKTVDSGVTNINVVSATGFSRTQSGEYSIAVPSPTTVNKNLQINMNQITGIITVSTADNYSDYTSSHLILEYTKSTT